MVDHGDKERWVHSVFQDISKDYDFMNDLESFGFHRLWKAALVRLVKQEAPSTVLDLACGTGDISLLLARALPKGEITGLDFSENMLSVARKRAKTELPARWRLNERGVLKLQQNLRFVQGNAMKLPFADAEFDVVTISFGLRNMADYAQVVAEAYRVLKPGGVFLCLEASYPTAPVIRPTFKLYFKYLLPTVANIAIKKPEQYKWLNDSTEAFLTKQELALLFIEQGFTQVGYRSFMYGAAALHSGSKCSGSLGIEPM